MIKQPLGAPQIINAILTCALPQNPELVYTLLHRQVGAGGRMHFMRCLRDCQ